MNLYLAAIAEHPSHWYQYVKKMKLYIAGNHYVKNGGGGSRFRMVERRKCIGKFLLYQR